MQRGDHPLFVDMRGATWTSPGGYEVAADAKRYEDWEFPYSLVLGLGAAARYATRAGIANTGARAFALANRLREGIRALDGASVLDRGRNQCAIVTAAFTDRDAREVVRKLSVRSINTSATLKWYGLLDFGGRNVESAVRISPHYYNTEAEIETCLDLLSGIAGS
jgi:selenocysteine lyase/cysteine desulfurase